MAQKPTTADESKPEIRGPYVDGAWFNKPSETVFVCVPCANDRGLSEDHALMYDDAEDLRPLDCDDCGTAIRTA